MNIDYTESWIYSADLNNEIITFYIDEISYALMMEALGKYPGYKIRLYQRPQTIYITDDYDTYMKAQEDRRRSCPCMPENGGSGICGCTQGGLWSTTCRHDG